MASCNRKIPVLMFIGMIILLCCLVFFIFLRKSQQENYTELSTKFVDHSFYGPIHLIPKDIYISSIAMDGKGIWEPHMLEIFKKYIKPGTVAIDVGANIGLHSLAMSKNSPSIVHAFEPQPQTFNLLKMNCSKNPRIQLHNVCLSDMSKQLSMVDVSNLENPGGAHVESETQEEEKVNCITLDSLNFINVSFIKIDVEGHEIEVIKGALGTITREKPVMIVEIIGGMDVDNASSEIANDIKNRVDFIKSLGYKVTRVSIHDYLFEPL
jgi:FkbM family methyltransferase